MSQIFGTSNFEDRLDLAFRGDAGEQRKRRKKLLKSGGGGFFGVPGVGRKTAKDKVSSPSSVGSNVFKSNLGGTNR